jgi:hypothetical protein
MFSITQGKGFFIKFENGFGLSVQWGPGNYCDHHVNWELPFDAPKQADRWESGTAEIAVIGPDGSFHRIPDQHDDVIGYQSADDVAKWIEYTKNL